MIAYASLKGRIKDLESDIIRVEKSKNSLTDTGTKYYRDHEKLIAAYKEVIAIYTKYIDEMVKS